MRSALRVWGTFIVFVGVGCRDAGCGRRQVAADPCTQWTPLPDPRSEDCPDPLNSDGTRKRLPDPPPGARGRFVLFHYGDFGPQVMASRLLNMAWWSWEAGNSWEMCDEFDVRVVVYDARAEREAKLRYPTIAGERDYRLVERREALDYLEEAVGELTKIQSEHERERFVETVRNLERMRSTIKVCLPE